MATAFKIEKGVEMPNNGATGRALKYPWPDMQVGDSFLVSGKPIGRIASAANYALKAGYGTFRCRTVEGGIRVWRTA